MKIIDVLPTCDAITGRGYLDPGERCVDLQIDPYRVDAFGGIFLTEKTVREIAELFGCADTSGLVNRVSELEADNARLREQVETLVRPWVDIADAVMTATGWTIVDLPPTHPAAVDFGEVDRPRRTKAKADA